MIDQNDINSKSPIEIFYGKRNNETKKRNFLDISQRFLALLKPNKDIIAIEILKEDRIPEDKYLFADLGYKYGYDIYKNGKFFLAGYTEDNLYFKERHNFNSIIILVGIFKYYY